MANVSKYVNQLRKLNGAIKDRYDYFDPSNLLYSSSPGINWLFGKNHGIPKGLTALLWGEKKSGKSLLFYDLIGKLHRSDPEAIAIKFDTEFRDEAQLSNDLLVNMGIDLERLVVIQSNEPKDIFDPVAGIVSDISKDGGKVGLIGIDSISGIQGRREVEQKSVTQHQIGDWAMTMQVGLKKVLPIIRKHKIFLLLNTHARDNMDPIEIMRGNKKKPAAANAVEHMAEFIVNVGRVNNKSGKVDELDRSFTDDSKKGMDGKGEQTGHKIYVWMQDNTVGPKNRLSEFTVDYSRGIVNTHEEIFRLGLAWKVIGRPGKGKYVLDGKEWFGKGNFLEALEGSVEMQRKIISELLEREKSGNFVNVVATNEEDVEDE